MRLPHSGLAATLAVLLTAGLSSAAAAAPAGPPGGAPAAPGAAAPGPGGTVLTLVTGDRITVSPPADGRLGLAVEPAARDGYAVTFDAFTEGGDTYVLPSDAARLVPGVLDRELFNVSRLVEYGYTGGVPVITAHPDRAGAAARSAAAPAGATVTATLPSINATAATVGPDGTWWRSLRAGAPADPATADPAVPDPAAAGLPGVRRVWLDGRVSAALDESVPQIGAPAAWEAGFDGTGVSVAVLDTGIDATHPDLAGAVVSEENFSNADTTADLFGHGTHVASILTGSGAASGGTYAGVAPEVELLNGKVLNDFGFGQQSDIIAGMEWAVQQGADIVNMSLGSDPTDGTDPMSAALNRLTDTHGVLFVVAAGNSGPGGQTVGTPAAADAALSVGNVTKDEQLATRSSRGPRLGDYAVKPEITGPGTDIVAARSRDGTLPPPAEPVDDLHIRASGTSMAAPHVAGAAALLHQQRPDLGPAGLKAALVSTAAPNPDLDPYQQGAGRVDVAAAIGGPVHAAPATLDFGVFAYPHDDTDPVGAEVTYTNRADAPVSLELDLAVSSRDGDPAAAGMVTVDPPSLTLQPGASRQVTVTVDVRPGEIGVYTGYLVAGDGTGPVATTPLSLYKEEQLHELTVVGIARDGRAAEWNSDFDVANMDGANDFLEYNIPFGPGGTTTLRLPPGVYSVNGMVDTYAGNDLVTHETTFVPVPEVRLDGDRTVVLDATEAVELTVDTPDHPDSSVHRFTLGYLRRGEGSAVLSKLALRTEWNRFFAVPTEEPAIGELEMLTHWRLGEPRVELELADPAVEPELHPVLFLQSPPLDGELVAPLVFAGTGAPEDYQDVDADGAIVLVRRGGPFFPEKERHAAAAGAVAMLVANDRPGQIPNYWVGEDATLPSVKLWGENGDALQDLLADGDVTVRLSGHRSSRYLYETVYPEPDGIPSALGYTAPAAELARVDNAFHSDAPAGASEYREMFRPWQRTSVVFLNDLAAPWQRTEYLVPGDTRYRQRYEVPGGQVQEYLTRYQPGHRSERSWWRQVARPGVREGGPAESPRPARRDGDRLALRLAEWVDAHGNWGNVWFTDTSEFRIVAGDTLLVETDRPRGEFPMLAEAATYRLELDVAREAEAWTTSTATRTAWTLPGLAPGPGSAVLPLLLVDYGLDVDLSNTAPHPRDRRGAATVDLRVHHQVGVTGGPEIAGARLWISYDDGASWRQRPGHDLGDGQYRFRLDSRDPAETNGFVSVRVEAWDAAGNRIEQEVTRAWALPPPR